MVAAQRGKRDRLLKLLDHGMVMVHLDARRPGVSVPQRFATDSHLRLNLSYRFKPCDLVVNEEGIAVTLSFEGQPWQCRIPLTAVFGLTSHVTGESPLWLEDIPVELLRTLAADSDQPQLHAVGLVEPLPSMDASPPPAPKPQGASRPYLRLVK